MIPISLNRIRNALNAHVHGSNRDVTIQRVVHDSRDVQPGDLFVAIRGQRLDGHQFVRQAVEAGAVACLCDVDWLNEVERSTEVPVLIVRDTTAALAQLAAFYRREVMAPSTVVVAVTGSNGKTTTKHMIDHVLRGSFKGHCAPKSFNNHIGVPLTLLSADVDDRYLIVEVGMNAPGEIAALGEIIRPDVAVITSIGEAHLLGLGSVEAIANEKASLLDFVQPRGFAVVNVDRMEINTHLERNPRVKVLTVGTTNAARMRVTQLDGTIDHTSFVLENRYEIELHLPGIHHATNAAAAFAVARWFGLSLQEIIDRLRTFQAVDGRTRRIDLGGMTIIDDSYNANPASMAAAIDTLKMVETGRRVFVMGDMFELGLESSTHHAAMVRRIAESGIEVLVGAGPLTCEAARTNMERMERTRVIPCEDAAAAGGALLAVLAPCDTVWIKGSRGMQLDRVVRELHSAYAAGAAVA